MKYVGVKTTGELRLRETDEVQTDKLYMAVEDTKVGASPIKPYQFVKWDGTKWVKVDNVELATTLDTKNIEDALAAAVGDLQDKIDAVTLDPSAVALGNVHLLDEVTEFPADGCILVDSDTNGPAKMPKDTLLTLTAQNALAGNVAPEFNPAKPDDEDGYAYYVNESVIHNGIRYRFVKNKKSGAWDSSYVVQDAVENCISLMPWSYDFINKSIDDSGVESDSDVSLLSGSILQNTGSCKIKIAADYKFRLAFFEGADDSFSRISGSGWVNEQTLGSVHKFKIQIVRADETELIPQNVNSALLAENNLIIGSVYKEAASKTYAERLSRRIDDIDTKLPWSYDFINKSIDDSGVESNSSVSLLSGSILQNTGAVTISISEEYKFRLAYFEGTDDSFSEFSGSGWVNEQTLGSVHKFKIQVIRVDNGNVLPSDINNSLSFGDRLFIQKIKKDAASEEQLSSLTSKVNARLSDLERNAAWSYDFLNKSISDEGVESDSDVSLLSGSILQNTHNVQVSIGSEYLFRLAFFEGADDSFSRISGSGWVNNLSINNPHKFKIQVKRVDGGSIRPAYINEELVFGANLVIPKVNAVAAPEDDFLLLKADVKSLHTNNFNLNEQGVGFENMIASWWIHPHAVHFKGVRDCLYFVYTTADGYSGVGCKNLDTGVVTKTNLKLFDVDDHNAPAVFVFDDGTIIAAYAGGHGTDKFIHTRRSKVPECIQHWDDDVVIPSSGGTTYSQFVYYDDALYLFYRTVATKWRWAYVSSTDKGKTWSSETIVLETANQWYCKVVPTNTAGLLRFINYSNPSIPQSDLREGFLDLSTGKFYDANLTTERTLPVDPVSVSDGLSILIPTPVGGTQRLLDVAVTDADKPLILFAPFVIGQPDSYVYKIYDRGTVTTVCNGTEFMLLYPKGASFVGTTQVVAIRRDTVEEVDRLELYDYDGSSATLNKVLDSVEYSSAKDGFSRPFVDTTDDFVVYNRGYTNSYTDFNTDAVIKKIADG